MLRGLVCGALLFGIVVLAGTPGRGQAPVKKDAPPGAPGEKGAPPGPAWLAPTPVVKLAVQPVAKRGRALEYRLLPDPLDLTPGNAAPLWLRAGQAARNVRRKITGKEYTWMDPAATPLKAFPRKEARALLAEYAAALRLADQAARRERCDWERPPLTIQSIPDLPLDEIQNYREIATLLNLRCRLELSEGRFDQAIRTLQTGFALARHVGNGESLIQDLVAIAIGAIMFGRVEEWIQIPGSPNLYWPLTELPRPFIDVRRSIKYELNTIHRSFPQLRELQTKRLTAAHADALVGQMFEQMFTALCQIDEAAVPAWARKPALAALTLKAYPDAKRYLIAQGRPVKEVEALPVLQAVAIYFTDQDDRTRDDILKWVSVPYWQGQAGLERVAKRARDASAGGNPLIRLLIPALVKVYHAQVRTERQVAGLRCAEALRLYAAAHGGKAPDKLAAITAVPLPIDPYTGKGFEGFYLTRGGKGVLEVPPPPGMPPLLGRHYELDPGR
jgi:hypothetical protein